MSIVACSYRFTEDRDLRVDWRGDDRWAVTNGGRSCLNLLGEWEYEPLPSNRDDEFIARCRYTLDEAIEVAKEYLEEMAQSSTERGDANP